MCNHPLTEIFKMKTFDLNLMRTNLVSKFRNCKRGVIIVSF